MGLLRPADHPPAVRPRPVQRRQRPGRQRRHQLQLRCRRQPHRRRHQHLHLERPRPADRHHRPGHRQLHLRPVRPPRANHLGGTTTSYLYDGQNVAQELSGGTPTVNYLLGPGLDQVYTRTDTGGTRSYLTNALGSVIALASSAGAVQTTYTYDPFGQVTINGTASPNRYQYTSRENDGTGLQYNRARYYNPALGRFISQDPAGQAGSGTNLYQYASDNPSTSPIPPASPPPPTSSPAPACAWSASCPGSKTAPPP
jgi:RHS repeat-associated protein